MPKERLQMPTPSQPTTPTRQGPTYDQLVNEVNILRAANVELQRRMGLNRLTIVNQNPRICAMDWTTRGLTANDQSAPRTKVQFHGSHGPLPAQQQPTPKTSPDSQVAFFNEDYDFSVANHGAKTLVVPLAPPMTSNGQFHPYAAALFGVGTHPNKLSGPSDLTANDDTLQDYSMNMSQQPSTLPTANAPVATPSKPALLPVTDGKLVADASVPPLSLKAAVKPAQPVVTTMAAAPAQESTTTPQQPAQQERQATPATDSLETQMTDGIFDFLNEDMFE